MRLVAISLYVLTGYVIGQVIPSECRCAASVTPSTGICIFAICRKIPCIRTSIFHTTALLQSLAHYQGAEPMLRYLLKWSNPILKVLFHTQNPKCLPW